MFLVIVANAWGRGESALEAANVARRAKGLRKAKTMPRPRLVYAYEPATTEKCFVDDFGSLCWVGVKPALVEKVGL